MQTTVARRRASTPSPRRQHSRSSTLSTLGTVGVTYFSHSGSVSRDHGDQTSHFSENSWGRAPFCVCVGNMTFVKFWRERVFLLQARLTLLHLASSCFPDVALLNKLQARPSTSKKMTRCIATRWSGSEPAISLRGACTLSAFFLLVCVSSHVYSRHEF